MKYIVAAFMLCSQLALAQTEGPLTGPRKADCYIHLLNMLTRKDTSVENLANAIIKPGTRTIYIIWTKHLPPLPATINGYKIDFADADTSTAFLYRAQNDSSAAIIYLDKFTSIPGPKQHIGVLPVMVEKKRFGRKRLHYISSGYKVYYLFENALNQYRFVGTEYFDYTAKEAGKCR